MAAVAVLIAVSACANAESAADDPKEEPVRSAEPSNEPRILIPDLVRSWPRVDATNCERYQPTHRRELVFTQKATSSCIEAALSSDSIVFFSAVDPSELAERRDLYEPWGEVEGHQVLLNVRGFELMNFNPPSAAAVPDTDEVALLVYGNVDSNPSLDPGIWPYQPSSPEPPPPGPEADVESDSPQHG